MNGIIAGFAGRVGQAGGQIHAGGTATLTFSVGVIDAKADY